MAQQRNFTRADARQEALSTGLQLTYLQLPPVAKSGTLSHDSFRLRRARARPEPAI